MSNHVRGVVKLPDDVTGRLERDVVAFRHRLTNFGAFGDRNLARIFDSHPGEYRDVFPSPHGDFRRNHSSLIAALEPRAGAGLLDAVKSGECSIVIRDVMRFQPGLQRLVERMYAELEDQSPPFAPRRLAADLLVAHLAAPVEIAGIDSPGIVWQIRGRVRINTVNDRAETFELQPGDSLASPRGSLNGVESLDGLSVTLCTGHFTSRQLRHARVVGANRLLRKWLKLPCRSTATTGVGYTLKSSVYFGLRAAQRLWFSEPRRKRSGVGG